jgi:hypothetical protein
MDASEGPIWFLGDLSDPWVVSIAEALPASPGVQRLDCPADLPERPFDRTNPPRWIVLHRHRLTPRDAEQLRDWRNPEAAGPAPAVILCVSPYLRYEDLERCSGLVNLVLSEATAADVLPRHLLRRIGGREHHRSRGDGLAFRIEVAGRDVELCQAVADACEPMGYRVAMIDEQEIGDGSRFRNQQGPSTERVLTIWELPVLETGWAERLERRSQATGPVIALVGFADRVTVTRAKAGGAIACLELPCDLDDLLDVIDRKAGELPSGTWRVPARVEPSHVLPPPPRRRGLRRADAKSPALAPPWSDRGPLPRIPR